VKAYAGGLLDVDLTRCEVSRREVPALWRELLVGGKGVAAKVLYDLVPPRSDPLGPDNVVVWLTGPLTGTLGPAMRGLVAARSPLTGTFCDSYVGGRFMPELKYAGFDGLIIRGSASSPVLLVIDEGKAELRPADSMWGMGTDDTYRAVKASLGDSSFRVSCIGPAGENGVLFALVDCEYHRQAGRGGLGAILGRKRLKAIACRGKHAVAVADPAAFRAKVVDCYRQLAESAEAKALGEMSSLNAASFANEMGFFPTRNYSRGTFDGLARIDPAVHAERLWLRHMACLGCPIHCAKAAVVRRGPHRKSVSDNVEYETLGMLGGNLLVDDVETLSYLNARCDDLGLDTISTGGVIGFALEAYERGLLKDTDTGGLALKFGDGEVIAALLEMIAYRRGIGDLLSQGVARAAEELGTEATALAVHVGALETPAWGPRGSAGMGLAYLTSDRGGCHQRAWPISYETLGKDPLGRPLEPLGPAGKAFTVAYEQDLQAALYSLVICQYGLTGISVDSYVDLLSTATGDSWTKERLMDLGARIWNLVRLFNMKHGVASASRLPPRFFEPLPDGVYRGHRFSSGDLESMLAEYYLVRQWDGEGHPSASRLESLRVNELITK